MEELLQELKKRLAEVADLQKASDVLDWDQQTYMPPGGAQARAEQLATLQRIAHTLFTSDEMGSLLQDLGPLVAQLPYDSKEASLIRVTAREYGKQRKISAALVAKRAHTAALAHAAWEVARANSDFDYFRPHLEKVVDLSVQIAEALGYEDRIYDALLDLYEPHRIVRKALEPILVPEANFEQEGFVPNVVFPTGLVDRGDTVFVYYGAADTVCAVAELSKTDILAATR